MDVKALLEWILRTIDTTIVPLLLTIAVLVFLFNVVRYFIVGGANEESQEKAKRFALWSILAFVVITGIWGIVNILTYTFDIDNPNSIIPDYMCDKEFDGGCQRDRIDEIDGNSNSTDGWNMWNNEEQNTV